MNIGVVTTSYPRWPGDAAGSFVAGHVTALRALGHDVTIVAAGEPCDGDRAEAITRLGGGALFAGAGAPDELEAGRASWPAAAAFTAQLAAHLAGRRFDLAIAHWLAPCALAAIGTRAPLLAIAHGGDVHVLRRARLLRATLAALHARRARIAFVSSELRALAGGHADDALVQPMGLPVEHFARLPRTPTSPPTIAILARLVPIKGIDTAIAALDHLAAPAQLAIAGDGPDRAQLAVLAARAPRKVTLLGALDAGARDRLLATASVVVVPSRVLPTGRTEGTPLAALEALAAGVPVVASAVGGLKDLAAAVLVAPDDPRALAAAIDRALAAPPSSATLRASVAQLGWPEVTARLLRHARVAI